MLSAAFPYPYSPSFSAGIPPEIVAELREGAATISEPCWVSGGWEIMLNLSPLLPVLFCHCFCASWVSVSSFMCWPATREVQWLKAAPFPSPCASPTRLYHPRTFPRSHVCASSHPPPCTASNISWPLLFFQPLVILPSPQVIVHKYWHLFTVPLVPSDVPGCKCCPGGC